MQCRPRGNAPFAAGLRGHPALKVTAQPGAAGFIGYGSFLETGKPFLRPGADGAGQSGVMKSFGPGKGFPETVAVDLAVAVFVKVQFRGGMNNHIRSEERRVGKEGRYWM